MHIAAEEVARKPQLLKEVDFVAAPAQAIWTRAIATNAEAWRGPADPQHSFAVIIQNVLDGGPANEELIAALATTPVADLSGYPRCAELWPLVADPTRAALLRATAAGWLERASSGDVACAPDAQLQSALLADDHLNRTLRALASTGTGTAVRIISALPNYDESRFLGWLGDWYATQRPMMAHDADTVGRLILDRQWRRAVDQLIQFMRNGRNDVKPALRVCHDLISIFTRWSLGLSSVSYQEKWTVLEDLAVDLYPTGPDDNELWDRAGGQNADLQSYGRGRSRWRDAIGQMRRGKGPRPDRLLDEMIRDFPSSDQVRHLANDPDLRSGCS
jgi:hypothetical protein